MERVDHIDVLQICSRRFIRHIYRVLERDVPDRERFEFSVTDFASPLVFMIQLRKTGSQLAAAAPRSRYDHQRPLHFDIRIGAVAFVAYDGVDVSGISFGEPMLIGPDPAAFQLVYKLVHRRRVVLIARHHHAVDYQIVLAENIHQPQHFQVIGNAEILSRLVGHDIPGINTDNDLRLVLHLLQELDLGVFIKPRQHAHGMFVLHQFASEFQIQSLAVSTIDPLQDIL